MIDLATGAPVHPAVSGVRGDISSVAFSPDGSRVLTTSTGPDVAVWDAHTGELLSRFPLPVGQQVDLGPDNVLTVSSPWQPSLETPTCGIHRRALPSTTPARLPVAT